MAEGLGCHHVVTVHTDLQPDERNPLDFSITWAMAFKTNFSTRLLVAKGPVGSILTYKFCAHKHLDRDA